MLPRSLIAPLLLVFIALSFLGQTVPLYTDYLWFQEVKFASVFITILWTKAALALAAGLLFALLVYLNVRFAARPTPGDVLVELDDPFGLPSRLVIEPLFKKFLLPGALVLGFLAGSAASGQWETFLRFLNAQPFNAQDPLFGRDIGLYVFRLPLFSLLYAWALLALGLSFLLVVVTNVLYRGIQITPRGPRVAASARAHLLTLGALILIVKAGGYHLDTYNLLLSPQGIIFGAGYSDINAQLPALRVLTLLSLGCAAFCIWQIGRPGVRPVLIALAVLVGAHILGLGVYPTFLQRFRVVPNEVVAERSYIEQNIKYTRMAFGLDRIQEQEFPAEETLTAEDLRKNDATIKNIRLWDHRPLLATYAQLQEIRTYYRFVDVDNDRYVMDGQPRQVMLSPREMSYRNLPSRIWINERLTYTHGFGVVLGPVNRITPEGLPEFWIKDIPPASTGAIKVTRPEIYYGETSNDYVFVKTRAQELDYPAGDKNVYSNYSGEGGVPIQSFLRKILFALRFADLKVLLSNDIIGESRVMYYREIEERAKKAAPFIQFDRDPYLVIGEDGRLFWIIDGYTTSNQFPYSEPVRGLGNYIRNSVKAVVDAYNGSLAFYLSEPEDPVIKAYAQAFPGLFQPLSAMRADLRPHIRYPQGLFAVQSRMYATYHMRDPQVFYNKEDLWSIPRKAVEGQEREMESYYTIMRLPGEKTEEFILLTPFNPSKKDNMIAWMAARSDGAHYGKLIAYIFPKQKLIYGPRQIDARIDQDAFISQQLSLWSQRGSQVIRGSLLAIPIEQSLLYVQPLYLAAEKGSLPELKRVIVAFGNQIAMEENLEASLAQIFGGPGKERAVARAEAPAAPGPTPGQGPRESIRGIVDQAWQQYTRAQEMLRQGNFAGYGEEVRRLEGTLKTLRERAQ
ncbi:MAG TPA: UPF0182 family protein [Candidatus Methylomirabilis sp.]|nr:UPF0182 family protein [Candidatus Methylomirabilis sp.]HSC69726.1 UPF0182 family protein [Candidatus Methylomirabilis sp.]